MVAHPLVGILALWFAARAFGTLANMCRQPAIIGELLAGVVFSPSFLGHRYVVTSPWLTEASLYAGAGFLFFAGFEIQLSSVKDRIGQGLAVALSGALVPFAIGYATVYFLPEFFGYAAGAVPPAFPLFIGISLAVSALPVIVRTLMDVGLYHSPIGSVTLSAVILDDILGWFAFSLIVTTSLHGSATDWVRFHMPVAAYLLGVIMGELTRRRGGSVRKSAEWVANRALSPLFFATIGLKLGKVDAFDLPLTLTLIGIATFGKVFAGTLAARLTGMPSRDAWAVGFAMNSRGAMSVMLSSLARELGLVNDRVFLSLVIMALVTSMISGPALRRVMKPAGPGWK